ncbi:MAG: hypothetical protein ACHP7D_05035 [Lysobacterales bacterium]
MKRRLHLIALTLFVITLFYDVVVWGALPRLPEVGASIVDSARREAPLASTYIAIGSGLDGAVPALQAFGEQRLTSAFGDGFERIRGDATVAMDLIFNRTWNSEHRWLKTMYWAAPFLLLLSLVLWVRRPKPVRVFGARR